MYAVVYADSGQVVALRRSEKEARQVAETRKAGGKLVVKRQASHGTELHGGNGIERPRQARNGTD